MNRKIYSASGLLLLAAVFVIFSAINNQLFSNWRLDLTENRLYTLSAGSEEVIQAIDEPITLYFFFSEKSSENLTALRAYARRVQSLLEEYALLGGDKIKLQVIDPEPFSEAEDRAAAFGLQSVPVNAAGDELYFGLAGSNALDDVATITFFQPDKEEFLEYEISKLVSELSQTKRLNVGLLSSLKVRGDVDMQTFATTPAWFSVSQLEQLFALQTIETTAESLPEALDLLVLIHPKEVSAALQYEIDQFVMRGGRLIAFVDPLAESDRPQQANPMMPSPPGGQASDINWLTKNWGISTRVASVVGDSQYALSVATAEGRPVRHLAILGLDAQALSATDVITANLESLNIATAGVIDVDDSVSGIDVIPLISSSQYAMPLEAMQFQFMTDPSDLQDSFVPDGNRYLIGARLQGSVASAFAAPPDGEQAHLETTDSLNVILVADTDVLTDRLWVQVQSFFGQQVANPFADNGDLLTNAVENLSGSSALISVRSRGRFTRPFEVVQDIRREAEAGYLESANALQEQLNETERQLAELQTGTDSEGLLVLTPEQEAALDRFQAEKLRIRKELRDVRHQMDREIEALGSWLKFINVLLVPLAMTLLLFALNRFWRRSTV